MTPPRPSRRASRGWSITGAKTLSDAGRQLFHVSRRQRSVVNDADRLRKDATSVSFAYATARGNHNHVIIGMLMKAAGADPRRARAIVYNAGSEATTAALGGHVDVGVVAPANVIPLLAAGKALVNELRQNFVRVTGDFTNEPIKAKIANAEHARVHTMLVLGPRDLEAGNVSVRLHSKGPQGAKPTAEVVANIVAAIKERRA